MIVHAISVAFGLTGLSRVSAFSYYFKLPVTFLDPPVSKLIAGEE
jgi:hypothetical protein